MTLLEQIRRLLFWTLDALRGNEIRDHFNDIKFIIENKESASTEHIRHKYLQDILQHATQTVPFYQKCNPGKSFSDFPVVDKAQIRDHFDSFRSELYLDKKNYKVTTSGTTGRPCVLLQDINKRKRNTADTIYFAQKAGFEVGMKLFYLRLWDKQYGKSNLLSWIQNISKYSVDALDEKEINRLIRELETGKSSTNILAYVSALHTVLKYLDAKQATPLNCNVYSVIAVAEGLNDFVKTGVKKYFNTEVISRYSNSENGIIAQQTKGNTYFELNWASYNIEILDLNRDIPIETGEIGRIVITDLFNYGMPLIRYDTGDVGKLDYHPDGKDRQLVLAEVEGRKMDMFTNTRGEYISSHIIHHILQYKDINQFQFIEEGNKEYVIKLKVYEDFDHANEVKIINQYKEYFGEDARIRIEYVKDIPLLPSGKRKLVINNALNKETNKVLH